ncbi:DUF2207 domain-containing protein [Mogibacterium pumilum]|uniref:DUF2207 domain-containing protein n=1 Tax=Mogibacterium pumilum TaxID=86332 RepID=A0A223ASB5_9FIRM|nr:DUF2207 domain-containing protein [Mogibacterium pumilum]ASS37852.1 hypothetical protein AXF17_04905 [Mogibacterium pumilum]
MTSNNRALSNTYKYLVKMVLIIVILSFSQGLFRAESFGATKDNSYEINNYDFKAVVKKNHNYEVTKQITVNLPNNLSELKFDVPAGNYMISDVDVKGTDFSLAKNGSKYNIIIKDKKNLRKGSHTFHITYVVKEYADKNKNYDLFYLTVLSPDWEVPIQNFKFTLVLPEDFPWDDLQYYAGQFGSQDVSNKMSYSIEENTITMRGSLIPSDFGITFKAELPDGYWKNPLNNEWTIGLGGVLFVAAAALTLVLWLAGGRDPKFKKKVLADPIDGISTADVAYVFNGQLSIRDIVPLIVRLGMAGCLKVIEYAPKKYKLVKLKAPSIDEDRYIRSIYTEIFEDVYEGRAIEMEDIGVKLKRILHDVESSVACGYNSREMRASTTISRLFRHVGIIAISLAIAAVPVLTSMYVYEEDIKYGLSAGLFVFSMCVLSIIARRFDLRYDMDWNHFKASISMYSALYAVELIYVGYLVYKCNKSLIIPVLILVTGAIGAIMTCLMSARARENARLANRMMGIRNFIEEAQPRDILVMRQSNPEYFYEMLPYAMQFSQYEIWAQKFRGFKVSAPEWFEIVTEGRTSTSNVASGDVETLARELHQFERTIESVYYVINRRRRFFLSSGR